MNIVITIQHTACLFLFISFAVGYSASYKEWEPTTQADWDGIFNVSLAAVIVTTLIRIWS